jgi:hypothetical protein
VLGETRPYKAIAIAIAMLMSHLFSILAQCQLGLLSGTSRQDTALLATGSPHKQKVTEERGCKEVRENAKQLGVEAKKKQ